MMRTIWVVSAAFLLFLNSALAADLKGTVSPESSQKSESVVPMAQPSGSSSPKTSRTIGKILIRGNNRVEEEAIRVYVKSMVGEPVNEEQVDRDVRAIYGMGFFKTVEVQRTEDKGQETLTYVIEERPLVRDVNIEGNKALSKEEIENKLKVHPRTILNPVRIRRGVSDVKKEYEKKGHLDADITYRTESTESGDVVLTFTMTENDRVKVVDVLFEGNKAIPDSQLRGIIQTKKRNLLSRFLNTGVLNNDALKTDVERITAYYYDNGYINVRVGEPRIERKDDGLYVTIRIDEGEQFTIGDIGFVGDVPGGEEEAKLRVELEKGTTFKASQLRDDVFRLTGYFSDQGYAFVNVEPETDVRIDTKTVNINYRVDKGPEVFVDRVEISGNTKTRDKVIRRELRVEEQGLFSASALQVSKERVQRLGYFEDVNVATQRGARNDLLNVLVDVKEAQTGAFSVGAGFNSSTSIIASARVQENNLFGRGQQFVIGASLGTQYRNSTLSFSDPYFLDTRFSLGMSLFDWRFAFEDFDRSGLGGSVRLSYPLTAMGYYSFYGFSLDDVYVGLNYQWEQSRISNFDQITPAAIRAERGNKTTGVIGPTILRNTMNHPWDPTSGSYQSLSLSYAGLGGSTNYKKAEIEARYFIPIYSSPRWGQFTWMTGGFFGYGIGDIDFVEENHIGTQRYKILDNDVPLFDRYFPGGINTIRGFGERSLGPRENVTVTVTGDGGTQVKKTYHRPIGGSEELIFNNEVTFPIVQQLNLKGVVFSDIGNAFTHEKGLDLGDLRYSVGAGVRWRSPFGPIRVEMGKALNPKADERTSTLHFSFGNFGVGQGGGRYFGGTGGGMSPF
jgi:outer membrane protein insertion porin family